MSEGSNIGWTDDTWNPWRGCTKVSKGCMRCYAELLVTRKLGGEWGKGAPRVRSKSTLTDPLKFNKKPWVCDECGHPALKEGPHTYTLAGSTEGFCPGGSRHRRRVFSLSLGDWLDDEVPIEWLADMLDVIYHASELHFLLLTKRPQNWKTRVQAASEWNSAHGKGTHSGGWGEAWAAGSIVPRIWLGVSVEDQETADVRIPLLLDIPAAVRFLSVEPLLESVTLQPFDGKTYRPFLDKKCQGVGVDWVIVGGESGEKRRDCGVDAIAGVAIQCMDANVPVFVKQDSAFKPGQQGRIPDHIWALKQFPQ